jgi:hypothetical protein
MRHLKEYSQQKSDISHQAVTNPSQFAPEGSPRKVIIDAIQSDLSTEFITLLENVPLITDVQ